MSRLAAITLFLTFIWATSGENSGVQWPPGAYCLLAHEDGCPEGFSQRSIQLAVPKVVQPGDTYEDETRNTTEHFIKYGKVGATTLQIHDWDQAYRLMIVGCCKDAS
ncbi:unnamed protein product, partial [Mesorhabditis spiculigera]